MRTKFIILLLIIFSTSGVYAKDGISFKLFNNLYEINFSILAALSKIELKEIVYEDGGSEDKISEITWDSGFCVGVGMKFYIQPADKYKKVGMYFREKLLWYMPSGLGKVVDTDWDYDGIKYSEALCTGFLDGGFHSQTDLSIGFPLSKSFLINVGVGFWYSRFQMMAVNGKIEQVNFGEDWKYRAEYTLYGVSMLYIQEWIVLEPVLCFKFDLWKFNFDFNIGVTPFIYGNHIDNHYFKKMDEDVVGQKYITYEDKINDGLFWNLGLEASYQITERESLILFVEMNQVNKGRGDTKERTNGLYSLQYYDYGMAGAQMLIFNFGILIYIKA